MKIECNPEPELSLPICLRDFHSIEGGNCILGGVAEKFSECLEKTTVPEGKTIRVIYSNILDSEKNPIGTIGTLSVVLVDLE